MNVCNPFTYALSPPPPAWKSYLLLFSFLLVILGAVIIQFLRLPSLRSLELSVFHLPGEAVFMELPQGHRVLIDTGETPEVASKLMRKLPFWARSLDIIVLTHADRDHIGGVPAILDAFTVGSILLPGTVQNTPLAEIVDQIAKERNIPLVYLDAGLDFKIGDITFDTLHPVQALTGKEIKKQNTASAVIRMRAGTRTLLLTGDIEKKEEKTLLATSAKLFADTIKVPHHGSSTSSSPSFLAAVRPQTALISAHKDNTFGHPAEAVLARYHDTHTTLFVTRDMGDIHYSLNSFE